MKRIKMALQALAAFLFEPLRRYYEANLCLYAYHGSATEASSDRNPPIQIVSIAPTINTYGSILGTATAQSTQRYDNGGSLWYYRSSDSSTLVQTAGYFADGQARGMRSGDVMMCVHQTSYGTSPDLSFGVLVSTNCSTAGTGSTGAFNMAIGGALQSS